MRRIAFWLMATISLVVLLFSYPTSTNKLAVVSTTVSAAPVADQSSSTTTGSASGGSGGAAGSTGGSKSSTTANAATSYTGTLIDTQYGPVQVRITVSSGKITAADAVQYPSGSGRDQEINAAAVPQLNSEVVRQQSASIDMVSGATYTSNAYKQSLQSAIDQANL